MNRSQVAEPSGPEDPGDLDRVPFDSVPNPLWVFDGDTLAFLAVNAAAVRLYGYSRDEFLAMTVKDILPVEEVPVLIDHLSSGSIERRVWKHRKSDGTLIDVEVDWHDFQFQGRRARLAVGTDTTERARAEQALRQAEAKYRTLVEQIPVVTYMDAPDERSVTGHRTRYMSPQAKDLLGYEPKEFEADTDLWPCLLHPDDRESVLAADAHHWRTGEPLDQEYRMVARDGRELWVRDLAIQIRDRSGQPQYAQGVLIDRTERRAAEVLLSRLARRLEALHEIDMAILSAESPADVARVALAHIRGLLACERASVMLYEPDAGTASFLAVNVNGELGEVEGTTLPLSEVPAPEFFREAGVLLIDDLERREYPELATPVVDRLLAVGLRSAVAAPLIAGETVLGVISVSSTRVGNFSASDEEVLAELADQLAIAIDQTRLREAERTQFEALERLVGDLRRTEEQRSRLLTSLVSAQEKERKAIASDIHDDPIQKVTAASMRLEMVLEDHPELAEDNEFAKALEAIAQSITSLRHLMVQLRPYMLDRDGLAAALRLLLEEESKANDKVAHHLEDHLQTEPTEAKRVILYRIAQEALVNVRKHARASRVEVHLEEQDDGYCLRISDDGAGFEASANPDSPIGHIGLTSMRERAQMAGGRLRIKSTPGLGTVVECWVPGAEPISNVA